ncbi:hypothetical protein GCM10007160_43250 [Litchfieldella qijiaojingensis]|uniref:Uncharacterized protein n=1 Tax=Litchfieldella qijiaojingensis TaxID=980347 RepID=A0ABQ2ZEW8_9GAMM|nr:hypothetical protein GCM10007160_43250 [Halomonas qijiaojingensis]
MVDGRYVAIRLYEDDMDAASGGDFLEVRDWCRGAVRCCDGQVVGGELVEWGSARLTCREGPL